MKISEMTNDQAADVLIRLSVPLGNICEDEETIGIIEKYKSMENELLIHTIGRMIPQIVSYLFKTHKEDLYEIVGALTFKKAAEVASMNFLETIRIVKDSYDEVLHDFFTSSVKQIKKTE